MTDLARPTSFDIYLKQHFHRVLLAIACVGMVIRLVVLLQVCDLPQFLDPYQGSDMASYKNMATSMSKGEVIEQFYFQPYYGCIFLPIIYRIFGTGPWAPAIIQILLAGASIYVVGLAGAMIAGRRGGILSAIFLAVARMSIFYTPFLLMATLQTLWICLTMYQGLRCLKRPSFGSYCVLALIFCASKLTRGNVLLFMPAMLALPWFMLKGRRRMMPLYILAFLVIWYLPQVPLAIHNYHAVGYWTGASTGQPTAMSLSNSPESTPGELTYSETFDYWVQEAQRQDGQRTPATTEVKRWLKRNPLGLMELKFRGLLLFWHHHEIRNNLNFYELRKESFLLRYPLLPSMGLLMVMGLTGMLLMLPRCWRSPCRMWLMFLTVVYSGSIALFYILGRFRVPITPLLCILSAYAVLRLVAALNKRTTRRSRVQGIIGIAGLAVCTWLVWWGFPTYNAHIKPWVWTWARPYGTYTILADQHKLGDHGQKLLGGWNTEPVPPSGLGYTKRFRLPPGESVQGREPFLKMPFFTPDAASITVMVSYRHIKAASKLRTDGETVLQWFYIPLPELTDEDLKQGIRIDIQSDQPKTGIVFDRHCRYGRTLFGEQAAPAEAVIDLYWQRKD